MSARNEFSLILNTYPAEYVAPEILINTSGHPSTSKSFNLANYSDAMLADIRGTF